MACSTSSTMWPSTPIWKGTKRDFSMASISSQGRREISWMRLYREVSHLGSLFCHRLSSKDGIIPRPSASLSLNFVSGCLVLFGGGCEGETKGGDP
ncbi:F-box/kelch-repeat protein-like [Iris pallida]|uniref:F-box/kelch-repeat protein-like n=1 Tax=Iris pallida TaxID=29817 RepID=A0AAX6FBH4_IRIPA|nr:F-box/kelch-repeat protein-like [Iris pallida]